MRLSNLSLPKSSLLPTNSNHYTAYIMSSNLTKTGPINPPENAPVIAPSEAYKGSNTSSNTSLELTPLQDKYEGVNWDRLDRYQWPYQDLLRTPSFIWDYS